MEVTLFQLHDPRIKTSWILSKHVVDTKFLLKSKRFSKKRVCSIVTATCPHFKSLQCLHGGQITTADYICFIGIIVSITKFSIVIGSPRAYLSHNRRAITWVSNYSCPIWTFCNRTPVNWIPTWFSRQLPALQWLPYQCFLQFSKLRKSAVDVFSSKKFSEDILLYKH